MVSARLNPGTGRYLIYLDNTANVNKGGLTGGNLYNRTYAGDPPASIAMGFGDSFIYANRPTLTFKANSFVQTNPNVPINYSYTVTGFVPGDPLGGVVSGTPTFNKIFYRYKFWNYQDFTRVTDKPTWLLL